MNFEHDPWPTFVIPDEWEEELQRRASVIEEKPYTYSEPKAESLEAFKRRAMYDADLWKEYERRTLEAESDD